MEEMLIEEGKEAEVSQEESSWLLQPGLTPDLEQKVIEIAQAGEITAEFLKALERELKRFQESAIRPAEVGLDCEKLRTCGSFKGGCPSLRECGTYGS